MNDESPNLPLWRALLLLPGFTDHADGKYTATFEVFFWVPVVCCALRLYLR